LFEGKIEPKKFFNEENKRNPILKIKNLLINNNLF